ncbi:LysR family transcriptional regulator [Rhodococcus globerulus]|uniref:LysR family transcriptional regulator n=1 Tax=Rhodococcus globerulus TaxID=33008 RepID=UPI001FAF4604|nr:LysR family transcriptional regulator [Rhodococcus globerulus]
MAGVASSRIQLRHLTCFVAVAQQRNLGRAAQRTPLTQPAVTKTLKTNSKQDSRDASRGEGPSWCPSHSGRRVLSRPASAAVDAMTSAARALVAPGVPVCRSA